MKADAKDECTRVAVPRGDHPGGFIELQKLDSEAEQKRRQSRTGRGEAGEEKSDQPERHGRVQNVSGVLREPFREQKREPARSETKKDSEQDEASVEETASSI